LPCAAREILDISWLEALKRFVQSVGYAGVIEHVAVGGCGNGEAVRHPNSFAGKLLVHLSERCVLASDERYVVDSDLVEEPDIAGIGHWSSFTRSGSIERRVGR